MKHKHAEFIKLMADGVRIETAVDGGCGWIGAYWGDFNDNNLTFRIAPKQPADEEGWIPWFGGPNPAPGKKVDYKLQGASFATHYRVVEEKIKKWRWMYTNKHNTGTEGIYLTPLLTEKEIEKWKETFSSCAVGPRQDWTEVCDE